MNQLNIGAVVEGHGEVESLPILIRRILAEVDPTTSVKIPPPIRKSRDSLIRPNELERAVELAARRIDRKGAVVVVLDSDGDAPCQLGPQLLNRAQQAISLPVSVVLAHCEWEAWYVASAPSLAGYRGLKSPLASPTNPESIRGSKEWLSRNMTSNRQYSPVIDQPAFAATFELHAARSAPSFDKLYRDILSLLK